MATIQADVDGKTLEIDVPEGTDPSQYPQLIDHVVSHYRSTQPPAGKSLAEFGTNAKNNALEIGKSFIDLGHTFMTAPTETTTNMVKGLPEMLIKMAHDYGLPELASGDIAGAGTKVLNHAYEQPVSTALDVAAVASPFLKGAGAADAAGGAAKAAEVGDAAAGATGAAEAPGVVDRAVSTIGSGARKVLSKATGITEEAIQNRFDDPTAVRAANPASLAKKVEDASNNMFELQKELERDVEAGNIKGGDPSTHVELINKIADIRNDLNSNFGLKGIASTGDDVYRTNRTANAIKSMVTDEQKAQAYTQGAMDSSSGISPADVRNLKANLEFSDPKNVPGLTKSVVGGAAGALVGHPAVGAALENVIPGAGTAVSKFVGRTAGAAVDAASALTDASAGLAKTGKFLASKFPNVRMATPTMTWLENSKYADILARASQADDDGKELKATDFVLKQKDPEYAARMQQLEKEASQ